MLIKVITTGGTIDRVYSDALSTLHHGESTVATIFRNALVNFDFSMTSLFAKDSKDITDDDRFRLKALICNDAVSCFLVTHGLDTVRQTAAVLAGLRDKRIVLTGAVAPSRIGSTDAVFNLGLAIGTLHAMQPGVIVVSEGLLSFVRAK